MTAFMRKRKNEVVEDTNDNNESKIQDSEIISAKERRRRKRKVLSNILESVTLEDDEKDEHDIEGSFHSESINSEDITRRNSAILKAFEKAVEDSKRVGVIHLESDEEVIQRIAQLNMGEFKNLQQFFVSNP